MHDVVRCQVSRLLHAVLAQVKPGSVPDIIQASNQYGVDWQRVPVVRPLPHPLEVDDLATRDTLEVTVEWFLILPASAL